MRIIHIVILMIILPSYVLGQVMNDTMYFDSYWEQTTMNDASYYRIISNDTSGEFLFLVSDYFLSGQIQMTGTYRSIRPDYKVGRFVYWYENGQKQAECHYHENEYHGAYTEWYETGQMKSKQFFYRGIPDGLYQTWRNDGTPKLEIQFSNGEKHGFFISYYKNGNIARKDLYDHGNFVEGQCFTQEGQPTDYFPYLIMPEFKGGMNGLQEFLKREMKYPKKALRMGEEGIVLVSFTVDEKGFVINPKIIQADKEYFNQEALRILSLSPQWIPGKVDGQASPVEVSIPVQFSLR